MPTPRKAMRARAPEMDQWILRNVPAATPGIRLPPRSPRKGDAALVPPGSKAPLPELVFAARALMLREGSAPDSAVADSLMIHAGWVLRVLEVEAVESAGGLPRARIQLAEQETKDVELAVGDGYLSPRSPGMVYSGWVDAAGPDGPNLKPFEKPPEVPPPSPGRRSPGGSPRRSPRKRLTPEQVHAASGLPISASQGTSASSLVAAPRPPSKEAAPPAPVPLAPVPVAARSASRDGIKKPRDGRKSQEPATSQSASSKKAASSMWAAFTETLFKGEAVGWGCRVRL